MNSIEIVSRNGETWRGEAIKGVSIKRVCEEAIRIATEHDVTMVVRFNSIDISATAYDTTLTLVSIYNEEWDRRQAQRPASAAGQEPFDEKRKEERQARIAQIGELLIRAAAVLGAMPPEDQREIRVATDGGLPDSIVFALRAASQLSPAVAQSLKRHPPRGLTDLVI